MFQNQLCFLSFPSSFFRFFTERKSPRGALAAAHIYTLQSSPRGLEEFLKCLLTWLTKAHGWAPIQCEEPPCFSGMDEPPTNRVMGTAALHQETQLTLLCWATLPGITDEEV